MSQATSNFTGNDNFEGVKDEYWRYIPLVKAALRGDWDAAEKFFLEDRSAITARITDSSETALYIAVGAGKRTIHFVEKLVALMPVEALALPEEGGNTALHTAAWVGNTRAAEVLVQKNPDLIYIRGNQNLLPLHLAALNARRDTLSYLLRVTKDDPVSRPFSNDSGLRLVEYTISCEFYDVALNLVEQYPQLAKSKVDNGECALGWLARNRSAFPSDVPVKLKTNSIEDPSRGDLENPASSSQVIVQRHHWRIWAQLLKDFSISVPLIKHIRGQKQKHLEALTLLKCICNEVRSLNDSNAYESFAKDAIITATTLGIHEVIEEIVDSFPRLIWTTGGKNDHNIFQRAIIDRQENVFNLIYQMGDHKKYVTMVRDNHGDNMLHLAGRLSPQNKLDSVPGAALQMQRELQWFKEVEKLVQPAYKECRNNYAETPAMVFTRKHKKLVIEGQNWMRGTAKSCTIVAALIVTVLFTAAITVPGSNNDTGHPIFSRKTAFITFAVSNALSLFLSTTSLLMFLSILISNYAESDFLFVLPNRLIIGLLTLFLSITTMIVAFSATLYLVFGHDKGLILIPLAVLAALPVMSFTPLQFPMLVKLISSTYGSGIFGKQSDRLFY